MNNTYNNAKSESENTAKEKYTPLVESLDPGPEYTIKDGPGSVSMESRVLTLPNDCEVDRFFVARHEMAHVLWSPKAKLEEYDLYIDCSEDARINRGLKIRGMPVVIVEGKVPSISWDDPARLLMAVALMGCRMENGKPFKISKDHRPLFDKIDAIFHKAENKGTKIAPFSTTIEVASLLRDHFETKDPDKSEDTKSEDTKPEDLFSEHTLSTAEVILDTEEIVSGPSTSDTVETDPTPSDNDLLEEYKRKEIEYVMSETPIRRPRSRKVLGVKSSISLIPKGISDMFNVTSTEVKRVPKGRKYIEQAIKDTCLVADVSDTLKNKAKDLDSTDRSKGYVLDVIDVDTSGSVPHELSGHMVITKPPMDISIAPILTGKSSRSSSEGAIVTRPDRMYTDGGIFSKKKRRSAKIGGTVLVDVSGSMSIDPDIIYSQVKKFGGSMTWAVYAGDTLSDVGELVIYSHNGYAIDPSRYTRWCGHGNVVDVPAIDWLVDQKGPKTLICDLDFTGRGDSRRSDITEYCYTMILKHKIKVFTSLHKFVKGEETKIDEYTYGMTDSLSSSLKDKGLL